MFKMIFKGIIFFMGIQSFFGNLQKQGIIEGSIKINYHVLQKKIISIINSDEFHGLIDKMNTPPEEVNRQEVERYQLQDQYQYQQQPHYREEYPVTPTIPPQRERLKKIRCFTHIVQYGDTLSDLAQIYGVSWKVIKRANHIYNERQLRVGQQLIIPSRMG